MNLVIKNTPPTQTYSLDSPSMDKHNGILFSIGESDIGRMLLHRSDLEKAARFLKTPNKGLDLPLDIRGARFQRRAEADPDARHLGGYFAFGPEP